MFTYLTALLIPPVFKDAERTRIAQHLHYILLLSIPVSATFLLLPNSSTTQWLHIIPAYMALFMTLLFVLLHRGYVRLSAMLLVSSGLLAIAAAGILSGGVRNPGLIITPLVLTVCSVVLGSRITTIFGIVMGVFVTCLFIAERLGLTSAYAGNLTLDNLAVILVTLGLTIVELHFTVTPIVQGAQQIRQQAQELQDKNWMLEQAQKMLEARSQELTRLNTELQFEISERAQAEAILRQKQKLESVGLLAGGVAHDFNNLLTTILSQSSLALRQLEPDHQARRHLEKSILSTQRATDLTRQLLAYAGKSSFETEMLDLNQLIQENQALLETLIQKNSALHFMLEPALPAIFSDRGQIQQVLFNLVLNATEAIQHDHGDITVATHAVMLADNLDVLSFVGQAPAPGAYVHLQVQDNGDGMSPAVLERIFDPYFTTKARGHGLGLSAVLGVIRGLYGSLQVTSTPGQGSCFNVYLPASTHTVLPRAPEIQTEPQRSKGEVILIIDDEAAVRETASEILQLAGYQTLSAASGQEGIQIFRQQQANIGAVLLDVVMPGINGPETLRQLRAIDSAVKVILTSGYSTQTVMADALGQKPNDFLSKPYTIEELTRRLATVLKL